jgi:hypothetical protein
VDWDDARLLPAAWLMSLSGMAALMLATIGAIHGHLLVPVFVAVGLLLLAAGHRLTPRRRWSVRLGSIAAALGIPVWLAVFFAMDRHDDPSIDLFSLMLAGASGWAARFLRNELLPPEWMRGSEDAIDDGIVPAHAWIEELPTDALLFPA